MLYTGDEMGYMQKWDVSRLLEKLKLKKEEKELEIAQRSNVNLAAKSNSTFMTGVQGEKREEITFDAEDVTLEKAWQAHRDSINCVSWVEDLRMIASCSFDCNVYVWNSDGLKTGSLVLGNRAPPIKKEGKEEKEAPEQRRYKNKWNITIDKKTRYYKELEDARSLIAEVDQLDYKEMKAKGALKKGNQG